MSSRSNGKDDAIAPSPLPARKDAIGKRIGDRSIRRIATDGLRMEKGRDRPQLTGVAADPVNLK